MARTRYGDLLAANNIRKKQGNQSPYNGTGNAIRRQQKARNSASEKNAGRANLGRTVRKTLREVVNETPRFLGNVVMPAGLGSHAVRRVMNEANRQKASPLRKRKPR